MVKPRGAMIAYTLIVVYALFTIFTMNTLVKAESLPSGWGDILSSFEKVSEQNDLVLYADLKTGEIAVWDKKNDNVWFSNPPDRNDDKIASGFYKVSLNSQILISYSDAKGVVLNRGSFLHCVQRGGLSHEKIENGIIFKYDFVEDSITVPVKFSIGDGFFSATVLTDEIEEYADNRLLTVDLLPYFGAGGEKDQGYMMIPDGSGALIYMNNGKIKAGDYAAPVYGEDAGAGGLQIPASSAHLVTITSKETIRLPVFGIRKNNAGFLAVITGSASRAQIRASVSGKGTSYNNAFARLQYRMSGTVLLTQKEFSERKSTIPERLSAKGTPFEVRYFFLDNNKSDYVGMAEKYREYLLKEKQFKGTVKEGDIPLYVDLYGYVYKIKPFLGIPVERVIPLTTLEDVRTINEILASNGIKNIVVKYNNWVKNASFKKIPVRAEMEKKLGSAKEFKELEKELSEHGASIYLCSDLINVYETGYGFSRYTDALKSVANTPLLQVQYALDSAAVDSRVPKWYMLTPMKFNEFFSRYTDNLMKLDTGNIGLDNIGSMCYSDMSSFGVSRTDIPGIVERVLEEVIARIPSLMLENANAYAVPYAQHIVGTPINASYYDIFDEHIPFYQIVYHGLVNLSMPAVNLSSTPEYAVLKALETGTSLLYSWVGRNNEELFNSRLNHLYSADYRLWIDEAIANYKKVNAVLSRVWTKPITGHTKLAEGVYMTTYGDELSVIVNYNSAPVRVNENTIEGLDYIVIEGR